MKLTTEQIEYVENYIISKDIKWYELQVELTDHMVTSMGFLGKKIRNWLIRSNNMLKIYL
jgi:chlorite dismutase